MFGIHTHFKIAVLQARSKSGALQQNTQTILAKMQEASRQGADVLLLAECFLTGYDVLPICNQDVLCENHFFADIEMSTLRSYRKSEMMGNTLRKTQAYADLISTKVQEPFIRSRFYE